MIRPGESPALAPPPGNPRFPLMDACRGVAALAIVVAHSYTGEYGPMFDWASQLRVGVQVFFALSGFLLFRPYLAAIAGNQRAPRLLDFLERRALRVIPGYWVALTVLALVVGPPYVRGVFSSHWWLFYGFGQAYSLRYNGYGLLVAWTLSVEVSFYLLLPLFAGAMRRLARLVGWRASAVAGVALLFAVGIVVRVLNTTIHDPSVLIPIQQVTYGLPGELPYFAAGMAVAVASVDRARRGSLPTVAEWVIEHPWVPWALAAACFAFGATFGAYHSPVAIPGVGTLSFRSRFLLNAVLEAVFAAAFLIPAAFEASRRCLPHRILSWRALGFLGLISYGLYLWHAPLGQWLAHHTALIHAPHWPLALGWSSTLVVFLALGVLAGTASYYVVELPFLRLKPGWRSGRRSSRSVPATTPPPAAQADPRRDAALAAPPGSTDPVPTRVAPP